MTTIPFQNLEPASGPNIPLSLEKKTAFIDTKEKPFCEVIQTDIGTFPRLATCHVQNTSCEMYVTLREELPFHQFSTSGELADELPTILPKPEENEEVEKKTFFQMVFERKSQTKTKTYICPLPKIGERTIQKAVNALNAGWKNLHWVWESEGNWSYLLQKEKRNSQNYNKKEIWLAAISGYDIKLVQAIHDRTH